MQDIFGMGFKKHDLSPWIQLQAMPRLGVGNWQNHWKGRRKGRTENTRDPGETPANRGYPQSAWRRRGLIIPLQLQKNKAREICSIWFLVPHLPGEGC